MAIFIRPPPRTWASNAGEVGRNRDSDLISGSNACSEARTAIGVIYTRPRPTSKLTTIVVGKRRALLTAGKGYNLYVKKPQRYAEFNTTANNYIRSGKSESNVTNDKRLLDVLYY